MFPWIWHKLSWKKSVLVTSEILELLVNTLTAEYKYSVAICIISRKKFKCSYLKNEKLFRDFLVCLQNVHKFTTFWKNRWDFYLKYSRNYWLQRKWIPKRCKRPSFRTYFSKQRFRGFETLLKLARHPYYRMFPLIWDKLSWKNSFLVRSEILGLFVNTMTAEYRYSRRNMQNFQQQDQTQLSEKRNSFLDFYFVSQMYIKFTIFWKKRWAF